MEHAPVREQLSLIERKKYENEWSRRLNSDFLLASADIIIVD
jgi:hypothetical protein